MKKKFFIHTFGCQMNENDSERVAGILAAAGAQKTGLPEEADIIIVNTCAVREKSEEKLFSFLGRMSQIKSHRKAIVGVLGCVAQLRRAELFEKNPSIDFILGPDNYAQLPLLLAEIPSEKFIATQWSPDWKETRPEWTLREGVGSAFVTIMEGCDNFCSYCVVPFTRGREKCRPAANILEEVRALVKSGYKEIQLLGQNVNSYRDPQSGRAFAGLLKDVSAIPGTEWIRFVTSHPKSFNLEIAKAMRDSGKVCHQLHLPLQSGSSAILKKMKREYSKEDYLAKIGYLKELMPDISLSTDIIVGFPGETDDDFKETLGVLDHVRFSNIFSFRYSARPRSAASRMEDDIPFDVKRLRLIELQNFQKNIQLELNQAFIGRTIKVLCLGRSKKDAHVYSGRNEGYQVVNFGSTRDVIGQFVDVEVLSCGPYSLRGEARG
jgi:tRNA-2-methylthio-N6-dimethylallyladenosine synthase